MDYELKRIRLRALFKISFIFYAVLGCIFGFIFLGLGLLIGFLQQPPDAISFVEIPAFLQGYFGIIVVVASSLAYGFIGAAFISVGALIYNVFSSWLGGVRVDVQAVEKE
jgi:hypothetical protein